MPVLGVRVGVNPNLTLTLTLNPMFVTLLSGVDLAIISAAARPGPLDTAAPME